MNPLASRRSAAAGFVAASTSAAAALAAGSDNANARCFPDDFMFGSATASYQVEGAWNEGGRTPSVWDDYCRAEGLACANVADDFYHRYKDDIKLMKQTNLDSFRFSVSWSRVMNWDADSHRMKVNPEGVAFYHSLIDELHANGLKPILTIYHWDLPRELEHELTPGGWLSVEIIDHFVQYSTLLFTEYGHKVDLWTTFNEPLSFVGGGYAMGMGPPGDTTSTTEAYTAAHNVIVSHGSAVKVFRDLKASGVVNESARIGIVLNLDYAYPLDATNPADVAAAERKMEFEAGWWLAPLVTGDYPPVMRERVGERLPPFYPQQAEVVKGSYDLLMLNHYGSKMVTSCDSASSNIECDTLHVGFEQDRGTDDSHLVPGTRKRSERASQDPHCAMFTAYPPGYLETIKWMHAKDPTADILLTENGWCGDDEVENMDQLWYFKAYVEQVHKAVTEEKIPVIGYTAWSFLDNYEWGQYSSRFGLYAVNFTSETGSPDASTPHDPSALARIPRPAAKWYTQVAKTKCLNGWGNTNEIATAVPSSSVGSSSDAASSGLEFGVIAVAAVVALAALAAIGQRVWRRVQSRRDQERESVPLL